ncbi:PREDICTED: dual specificity protein phosphatase 3-like [Dinoponera quadriceps]|uniref:Dual specificity protein phosphatase n=1 Tax=Dinoponera quadriceps TaxID=609295 RepID=A0A6P3XE11_DINQU|nr:PREDICTED: dual specificity protein phosphatase 3-like [Dinoponera quadriceps]
MRRVTWRDNDRDFRQPLPGGETTGAELTYALYETKTEFQPLPGSSYDPNIKDLQYFRAHQKIDCDEVYPRIYIGNGVTAKNKKYLEMLGITHLLNAAEGKRFGFVNTDSDYYADTNIKYYGILVTDLPTADISKYFYTVADFIDEAMSTGGKAFVHCMQGVSRSATCVLAYLMIKKKMLAVDALRMIRVCRDVHPNAGFLEQLARLDNRLRRQQLKSRC